MLAPSEKEVSPLAVVDRRDQLVLLSAPAAPRVVELDHCGRRARTELVEKAQSDQDCHPAADDDVEQPCSTPEPAYPPPHSWLRGLQISCGEVGSSALIGY